MTELGDQIGLGHNYGDIYVFGVIEHKYAVR
jgi:hypothetical protein